MHWQRKIAALLISCAISQLNICLIRDNIFSFQDTVVAIQALAQYGYLTFSKESHNTVKVNFMEIPKKAFHVNDENRFLLQQTSLPTVLGNYSVEVYGTGCVYMQVNKLETHHHPAED